MKQILIGQIHVKYITIFTLYAVEIIKSEFVVFKNIFILTDILLPELMKEGEWVLL